MRLNDISSLQYTAIQLRNKRELYTEDIFLVNDQMNPELYCTY